MDGIINWTQIRQTMLLATHRIEFYNPSYWDKQANAVNENMAQMAPLTRKQLKKLPLSSEYTFLDVGAGTGRMTIPIAKRAKHVTALEPSENMLALLKANATKQHIINIHYVNKSLEELDEVKAYDFVVASFSLFMFDIQKVLKMDAIASRGVYLFLSASPWMDEEMQNVVYGNSSACSDFIFVFNILHDAGILANVEFCTYDLKQSYDNLEDALSRFKQTYRILPEKEDKLREHLRANLVEEKGKLWWNRKRKAAMIWWTTNK